MLNGTLKKITQNAEFQSRVAAQGTEPFILSPEQFKRFIASEVSKWAKLGTDYKLRVE
jgi:tripartite-type tricarboxylate transporter receptor subunit TctC